MKFVTVPWWKNPGLGRKTAANGTSTVQKWVTKILGCGRLFF